MAGFLCTNICQAPIFPILDILLAHLNNVHGELLYYPASALAFAFALVLALASASTNVKVLR